MPLDAEGSCCLPSLRCSSLANAVGLLAPWELDIQVKKGKSKALEARMSRTRGVCVRDLIDLPTRKSTTRQRCTEEIWVTLSDSRSRWITDLRRHHIFSFYPDLGIRGPREGLCPPRPSSKFGPRQHLADLIAREIISYRCITAWTMEQCR